MADNLDVDVKSSNNGYPTPSFEAQWYGVTLLGVGIPQMDLSVPAFSNGMASTEFEAMWSEAAGVLGKDELDVSVILIDSNDYPTPDFEAAWKELIT